MDTIKYLRIWYIAILAIIIPLGVLFESGMIDISFVEPSSIVGYWAMMTGAAFTIIGIPLALKWMTLRRVKAAIKDNEVAYRMHYILRLYILSLTLDYNFLFYYISGCEPAFGYMALMVVVAFLFVWPSEDKMRYEMAAAGEHGES